MSSIEIDLLTEPAGVPHARAMLQRAQWAARSFGRYDKQSVDRIVSAVATVAEAKAHEYAEWAVRETGFGVPEHKVIKNIACSVGVVKTYRDHDYVTPRFDSVSRIVEVPRPAGVVLALTPSTNPVATVYFNVLLCLMTRNAVVVSPHPLAREVCTDAARALAAAAVEAGAPDGAIQVVDTPSIPLIDALMTNERTNVIIATGGGAVVHAAYSSGTPAIGVGPSNVPVLVDETADLSKAAQRIVDSKSFDNSILCTNESVLIVVEAISERLLRELKRAGAHLLTNEESDRIRSLLFPEGKFDARCVGKSAAWLATEAGIRVDGNTRVLLAPFDLIVPEEVLAHEKLCPVLGFVRVESRRRGIDAAIALLRITGAGHSAVIHSTDPQTIMEYGAKVPALRVVVNVGNSLGSAGIETNLAPSMTIGTGFYGHSSLTENLQPKHLVQWTRIAYNAAEGEAFGNFSGLIPWEHPLGLVPPYPTASNQLFAGGEGAEHAVASSVPSQDLRQEIRRLIVEELKNIVKG